MTRAHAPARRILVPACVMALVGRLLATPGPIGAGRTALATDPERRQRGPTALRAALKDRVRRALEERLLPGVPWRLLHLSLDDRNRLGVIVQVGVTSGADQRLEELVGPVERGQDRLATALIDLVRREFPGLCLARHSAVIFRDPARDRSWTRWLGEPAPRAIPGAVGARTGAGPPMRAPPGTRIEARLGAPASGAAGASAGDPGGDRSDPAPPDGPAGPAGQPPPPDGSPGTRTRSPDRLGHHRSRALRLAQRLREELRATYPDPIVEVVPEDPPAVRVHVLIRTPGIDLVNRPHVERYLSGVRNALFEEEFADLTFSPTSRIVVTEELRTDLPDMASSHRQIGRSRTPRELDGLSRILEGRIRSELMALFPSVEVAVVQTSSPYPDAHELIVKLVARSDGDIDDDNRGVLRNHLKRTVKTLLAHEFPRFYLSPRSRFVVWSPHETIRTGLPPPVPGFQTVSPVESVRVRSHASPRSPAGRSRFENRIVASAPLAGASGILQELPVAYLPEDPGYRFSLRFFVRSLDPGVFANVDRFGMVGLSGTVRTLIAPAIEGTVGYAAHALTGVAVGGTGFDAASPGMGVATAGLKVGLPTPLLGMKIAFGGHLSLVSSLDQPLLMPEEHARYNNAFVTASLPLLPGLHLHAGSRLGLVLDGRDPEDGSALVLSSGGGLEWQPYEQVRFYVEALTESLSADALGDYGRNLAWNGPSVNLGFTAGVHALGNVHLGVRRINRLDDLEVGLVVFNRI